MKTLMELSVESAALSTFRLLHGRLGVFQMQQSVRDFFIQVQNPVQLLLGPSCRNHILTFQPLGQVFRG